MYLQNNISSPLFFHDVTVAPMKKKEKKIYLMIQNNVNIYKK